LYYRIIITVDRTFGFSRDKKIVVGGVSAAIITPTLAFTKGGPELSKKLVLNFMNYLL